MKAIRSYLSSALLLFGMLALGACDTTARPNIVTAPGTQTGAAVPADTAATTADTTAQNMLVTASSLLDLNLQNQGGEDIGQINDFIVNMSDGNIPYATVRRCASISKRTHNSPHM